MQTLAIAGTGTDVGKTFVACALIAALRAKARPVDAFKPVLSGFSADKAGDSDAGRLLSALGRPLTDLDAVSPLRFAAPLAPPSAARLEGVAIARRDLIDLCRRRMSGETLLLLEGAGGVASPIADDATNLDLFAALDVPVLLVGGSYLGAISHTLTALEVTCARGLTVPALVVSESAGEAPPISEMTEAMARFAPGLAVFVARRDQSFDAGPLADALYARP